MLGGDSRDGRLNSETGERSDEQEADSDEGISPICVSGRLAVVERIVLAGIWRWRVLYDR